jgi:predicted unusual protein kinase regulating ubiquinone biosynthesis (AarF/ABC1/UbiB family)
MPNPLPTSKLSRGAVVGKAALRIGASQAKGYLKRKLGSREQTESHQSQTHEETAQILIDALGHLKGVSVKIAQQIALGMPFLPPEYLEKISQSFSGVPPINRALIRKVIRQELGANPEAVFSIFENEPFGAASLGQVHRATYKGQALAIKVQYPGIAKSIDSDMSMLRFALTRFAKGQNIDHLMEEINGRLREEVDYVAEAENTRFFGEHLGMEHIIIPKVYDEVSSSKVLGTQFLEGMDFDAFMQSDPPQDLRDHYAQLIFDSFFVSLYQLRQIHADPNPGNFLFMENGKLGMIDFGCVKRIDEGFLQSFNTLHLSLIDEIAEEEIVRQYIDLRMIDEAPMEEMLSFYREVIKPLDQLYIEIFREEHYDFKVHTDFSKRGFDTIMTVQQKQLHTVNKLNEEYIFLDRTLLGYYAMFERMGARIDTRFAVGVMREFG